MTTTDIDVVVVGGGQAGLAAGYYLRRAGHQFLILDDQPKPGGAWPHTWPSLRLFSPAQFASLPGWPMPPWPDGFPPAQRVIDYLRAYEERYQLPVRRPVRVHSVVRDDAQLLVTTSAGQWRARRIISATGTWQQPFWPIYPGAPHILRSAVAHCALPRRVRIRRQTPCRGRRWELRRPVARQDLRHHHHDLVTNRPPRLLPDDVDGRVLFEMASKRAADIAAGRPDTGGIASLGYCRPIPLPQGQEGPPPRKPHKYTGTARSDQTAAQTRCKHENSCRGALFAVQAAGSTRLCGATVPPMLTAVFRTALRPIMFQLRHVGRVETVALTAAFTLRLAILNIASEAKRYGVGLIRQGCPATQTPQYPAPARKQ